MLLVEGGIAGIISKYSNEKHTSPVISACILWLQVAACATTSIHRCSFDQHGSIGLCLVSGSFREGGHTRSFIRRQH
jgi:hypothetical protein